MFGNLKEVLSYNPNSGDLIWKVQRGRVNAGDIAGSINKDRGYKYIKVFGKMMLTHRVAWYLYYGVWPEHEIDHINHDRIDNRITNLREVNSSQQSQNRGFDTRNTSGMTGVYWSKRDKIWYSDIKVNGTKKYLGSSKDFFKVCCLRKSAENKYGFHINHGREQ